MAGLMLVKLFKKAFKRGPLFIVKYLKEVIFFDIRRGTDTYLTNYNSKNIENIHYVASFTSIVKKSLRSCLNFVPKDADFEFIDIGFGKGKVLILAEEELSCSKIMGIEYDKKLFEIAKRNIRKKKIDLFLGDAKRIIDHFDKTKFQIIFFYNSFKGGLFKEFIGSLKGYNHCLIYLDPEEHKFLINQNYKVVDCLKGKHKPENYFIYVKK